MKPLTLILATLALALTACGAPFEAGEFSPSIGQAGSLDAAGGSGGSGSAAGALGHAGSAVVSEAGQGGSEAAAAGAAGEPSVAQGGTGSAGGPQGGTGSAGAGGAAGHAGASSGGAGGVSSTGGTGGIVTPPGPPCAPAVDVSTKSTLDLGVSAVCLKTTADFNYLACSNWDARIIKLNGIESPCWTGLATQKPIDGYNYIEISAGTSQKANLAWSHL